MGDDPGPGCLEMNIWSVIRAAREHGGDLVSQSSLTVRTGEVTRTRPKVPRYVPRQPGPAWLCCQLIRTVWPLTTFRFLIILIIFGCRERIKKTGVPGTMEQPAPVCNFQCRTGRGSCCIARNWAEPAQVPFLSHIFSITYPPAGARRSQR